MDVNLRDKTRLLNAAMAARTSHGNGDKSDTILFGDDDFLGEKDASLLYRVANKFKHKSVLEQLVYVFNITGISRTLLQELARHRTARLTVKSTRYTLKELKDEPSFFSDNPKDCEYKRASKYLKMTGVPVLDGSNVHALSAMQYALREGISNDIVKYALPEAYLTETVWQIDGRNLQNLLQLRTHSSALAEFQELANKLYEALPEAHKYLYADYVYRVNPIQCNVAVDEEYVSPSLKSVRVSRILCGVDGLDDYLIEFTSIKDPKQVGAMSLSMFNTLFSKKR